MNKLTRIFFSIAMLLGLSTSVSFVNENTHHVAEAYTVTSEVKTYTKVTTAPEDWSGTYVIAATKNNKTYVFNGKDVANGYVLATETGGQITIEDTYSVEIAKMTGGYSVYSYVAGKYMSGKSVKNALNFGDTAVLNTIEFVTDSNSNTKLKITSNGSEFQFYSASDQLRFRYYKSSQTEVSLYKLETDASALKDFEVTVDNKVNYSLLDNPCYPTYTIKDAEGNDASNYALSAFYKVGTDGSKIELEGYPSTSGSYKLWVYAEKDGYNKFEEYYSFNINTLNFDVVVDNKETYLTTDVPCVPTYTIKDAFGNIIANNDPANGNNVSNEGVYFEDVNNIEVPSPTTEGIYTLCVILMADGYEDVTEEYVFEINEPKKDYTVEKGAVTEFIYDGYTHTPSLIIKDVDGVTVYNSETNVNNGFKVTYTDKETSTTKATAPSKVGSYSLLVTSTSDAYNALTETIDFEIRTSIKRQLAFGYSKKIKTTTVVGGNSTTYSTTKIDGKNDITADLAGKTFTMSAVLSKTTYYLTTTISSGNMQLTTDASSAEKLTIEEYLDGTTTKYALKDSKGNYFKGTKDEDNKATKNIASTNEKSAVKVVWKENTTTSNGTYCIEFDGYAKRKLIAREFTNDSNVTSYYAANFDYANAFNISQDYAPLAINVEGDSRSEEVTRYNGQFVIRIGIQMSKEAYEATYNSNKEFTAKLTNSSSTNSLTFNLKNTSDRTIATLGNKDKIIYVKVDLGDLVSYDLDSATEVPTKEELVSRVSSSFTFTYYNYQTGARDELTFSIAGLVKEYNDAGHTQVQDLYQYYSELGCYA